jgi:hypothetical protein
VQLARDDNPGYINRPCPLTNGCSHLCVYACDTRNCRCSETERQLASLRDLEDGGGGGAHDAFDAAAEEGESSAVIAGGSAGGKGAIAIAYI